MIETVHIVTEKNNFVVSPFATFTSKLIFTMFFLM